MKNLGFLIGILLIFSCGSDDEGGEGNTIVKNYFPQHLDNSWSYESTSEGNQTSSFDGTQVLNGETFNKLINQSPIFGFTGDSYVRKQGNDYFVNSTFSIGNLPPIVIENEKFLDEGMTAGDIINSINSDSALDVIPLSDAQFSGNVTPNISFKTDIKFLEHYSTITLNGSTNYEDVIKVKWTYYISSDLHFIGTDPSGVVNIDYHHPLITEQQAGTLVQYFVNEIGVARSEFNIDLSGINFNNTVSIAGGAYDISTYTQTIQNSISSTVYNNVSELSASLVFID